MTARVTELMDRVLVVFGERDGVARRSMIDAVFTEDVRSADVEGVAHGRAALDARIEALLASTPAEFVFAADGPVREVDDLGYRSWTLGPRGGAPVVSGTDIILVVVVAYVRRRDDVFAALVREGSIAALYTVLTGPSS